MTGLPDFNYPAFHKAESRWRSYGHHVVNPARHFNGRTDLPRDLYLKRALVAVMGCDAIVLLPGWQHSPGAKLELAVAIEMGHDIFDNTTGLPYAAGVMLTSWEDL